MDSIKNNLQESLMNLMSFVNDPENANKIEVAGDLMVQSIRTGGKIITCGNGGSMCDAMHLAEELTGRFQDDRAPLPAVSISDPSHLTCVANDYGFDQVFSRYVQGVGAPGDVLVAISTSGNSANVVKAAKMATGMGMLVVGLTGARGKERELTKYCDVEIVAPNAVWADKAQEVHGVVIHALIFYIEQCLEKIKNEDRIGIGTTSPSTKINVTGDGQE